MNTKRVRSISPFAVVCAVLAVFGATACADRQPVTALLAAPSEAASEPVIENDAHSPRGHATHLPPGFVAEGVPATDGEPDVTMTRYLHESDQAIIAIRTFENTAGEVMLKAPNSNEAVLRGGKRGNFGVTSPDAPHRGVIIFGWHETDDVYVAVMSRGFASVGELRKVAEGVVMENVR